MRALCIKIMLKIMHKTRLRQQDGFVLYFYFLGTLRFFFRLRTKLPLGGRGESPSEGEGGTEKEELFMAR